MAINYDGTHEVRIFYTVPVSTVELAHRHTIDVRISEPLTPGTDPASIDVDLWNGGTLPLPNQISAWVDVLKTFYHSTANFSYWELWQYEEGSNDGIYICSGDLGVVGTNAGTAQAAQQTTITFRSVAGGVMRVQLMESSQSGSTWEGYPFGSSLANAVRTFLIAQTHGFQARDNTRPVAAIRHSVAQNEKLFRKRFRP